jgi:hypothetical protein
MTSSSPSTRPPRRLDELVDLSTDGPIPLDPVLAAVGEGDVACGVLTDEEVHWLSSDPDAAPRRYLDAPRLGALGEPAQDAALDAVLVLLLARGEAEQRDDGVRLRGLHAVLGDLRSEALVATVARTDVRGEGSRWAALYAVRQDLYLHEEALEAGVHSFVLCAPARAAVLLAHAADPLGRARWTGEPQQAPSLQDLVPPPDDLVTTSDTSTTVYSGRPVGGGELAATVFTAYGGEQGLVVVQARPDAAVGDGEPGAASQVLDGEALVTYCAQHLGLEAGHLDRGHAEDAQGRGGDAWDAGVSRA